MPEAMYPVIAETVFVMHLDRAYILSGMFTEAVHSRQLSGDDSNCAQRLGGSVEQHGVHHESVSRQLLAAGFQVGAIGFYLLAFG